MRLLTAQRVSVRLSALILPLLLTGCVLDRMHQPVTTAKPVFDLTPPIEPIAKGTPYVAPKPPAQAHDENHATVEFKNHGKLFDDCPKALTTKHPFPCQLDFAVDFIHAARRKAMDEHKQLVVLTFIHGNENNATTSTDNYPHFEQLISCLNLGDGPYHTQYPKLLAVNAKLPPSKPRYLTCDGVPEPREVMYAGIFIGWQGKLTKSILNLQQNAAMRIGSHHPIVHALFALRNGAKDSSVPGDPARFIVVGHSFGGLMLEQAGIQIFSAAYSTSVPASTVFGDCDQGTAPTRGYRPFTDLVFTLNEAVNSVPAKHLIEFLMSKGPSFCHGTNLSPALERPLLISLHSKSDFFTGRAGTVLRYIVPPRGGLTPGRFQAASGVWAIPPNWLLLTHSTPANLSYFQNLCYIDQSSFRIVNNRYVYKTGDWDLCDPLSDITDPPAQPTAIPQPSNHAFALAFPSALSGSTLEHLHLRYFCDRTNPALHCLTSDPGKDPTIDLHIWNRSPFWLVSVDDNVISGHNDFWTANLVTLIQGITTAWAPLTLDQVLPEPNIFVP